MKPRHAVLLAALGATLAAVWWVGREEATTQAEVVAVARRQPDPPRGRAMITPRPTGAAATAGETEAEAAPRFPGGGPDLFPAISWRPPPPPVAVVKPAPPPPPMAPPLPFKYVGRWADGHSETVFLAIGERLLNARAGQRLEQWRLDKVGADSLDFTYLPLDQQRQLRLTP